MESFDVYAQEIVTTKSRHCVSIEVLARPRRSLIPTSVYYDLLSCSQARKITSALMTSIVNIDFQNIGLLATSGEEVQQLFFNVEPELLPEIRDELVEFNARLKMVGVRLVIELTERVSLGFYNNYRHISKVLFELNDEGLCFAIDDFEGSLDVRQAWLSTGAISFVKIVLPDNFSILNSAKKEFLFLAEQLKGNKFDVIVEKVETFNELLNLDLVNCDYVQGLFFGEPQKIATLNVS